MPRFKFSFCNWAAILIKSFTFCLILFPTSSSNDFFALKQNGSQPSANFFMQTMVRFCSRCVMVWLSFEYLILPQSFFFCNRKKLDEGKNTSCLRVAHYWWPVWLGSKTKKMRWRVVKFFGRVGEAAIWRQFFTDSLILHIHHWVWLCSLMSGFT